MDAKAIWLAIVSAVLALLGKIVFDWLSKGRRSDTTGDKDPEYWLQHLDEIKTILQARNVVFAEIDSKLTALKESTSRIEGHVTDALRSRARGR